MIRPYYQDEHATIYHGDYQDIITDLDYHVIITDPPYGISYQSNMSIYARQTRNTTRTHPGAYGKHDKIGNDEDTTTRDNLLKAIGTTPAAVFGKWTAPRPANTRQRLIWHKGDSPGMGDLQHPWGPADEEIYILGDGWHIPTGAKRQGNVVTHNTVPVTAYERQHPTPKPEPLMRHIIERTPPGVICDPFMGSGTTLRAAKDLGRHSIGIELEERYCEIAANRLAQEVLDLG